MRRKLPAPEIVVDLYVNKGLSTGEIGKMYNISGSCVARDLNKSGVTMRSTRKLPARNIVVDLYVNGCMSTTQIAKRFGVNKKCVIDDLHRANIKMKTYRDYPTKKGKDNHNWKGGRYCDCRGYVILNVDGRRIPEHRYIMEQHIGRKLNKSEIIHHINAIKGDNRIENLMIVTRPTHDCSKNYKSVYINRIRELEQEVKSLKNICANHNIRI